ncbi:F0F1 ATP synthase subunit B [Buchnera aphidicola (Acyrthosiphon lactucae)]|uniref:ATP synthase subunit b n=1 Tax=Buchnera aphidicola (Acyrthosiphon lactucae) TaxID=1241832 RepID=A0A4D6XSJ3_9GAMM|nr:F0F1 ATP synthase subunit B [Buchnera aphidicola]QCI17430.1 F0F1 ATP synthase subunit B [Buchnera aphidicola (Acyrthosiphon lactucae)]
MNLNATIVGQAISFFLFVWFCMKYVWPPIILAIETRQKEIKESLINSKKAQDELYILEKKIKKNIIEAKQKASNILNEANKQKELILEEARKNALEESKKILLNTQSEIEISIIHARKNLHKEVVDLSIAIAEKIIKKNISKEDNQNLLDQLVVSLSQVKN